MATQDCKPRRKPVTYGKKSSNKALPMYNSLDSDLDREADEASRLSEKPATNDLGYTLPKRSRDTEPNQTIDGGTCSGDTSPVSPNSSTQGKSDHTQNDSANSSLFDLVSSEDDLYNTVDARPTTKRRKLTPVGRTNKPVQGIGRKGNAVPKSHDNRAQDITTAQSTETIYLSSSSERLRTDTNAPPRPAGTSRLRKKSPAPKTGTAAKITMDLIDSEEEVQMVSVASSPTPPHTPVSRSAIPPRSDSSSPSAQLIDQLHGSIPFERRLTKRVKRGVASPSQLALRSLRLTPEAVRPETTDEGHNVLPQSRPLTPSRSRRRLIDALDSPRRQPSIHPIDVESPNSSPASSISGDSNTGEPTSHIVSETNNNLAGKRDEIASKPLPALPAAGPKVTYAKQRSHLSDMVLEDLSDFAVPAIAHLVEPAATAKASAAPSFGPQRSQRSQEAPRDEEDATGGAIRSIHELRQAGENSRFQGNLDSIFEDLEAAGRTGRSRRLRGLMLLTQKVLEPSFCLRFVETGMHNRLADHTLTETDMLSSMLTSCVISILLCSGKPSVKVVQQVVGAIMHSSAPLLEETKELSKFVRAMSKDRKQNLSGAMCKDLIEFQQTLLASPMWTTPKPSTITPQLIALRSIEIAVRGLRESKDFDTPLPVLVLDQLVAILEGMASNDDMALAAPESVLTLESTISVLESSALSHGLLGDGHSEAAKRLGILAPLLAKADVLPRECHDRIRQLVLRLIISVTNNNHMLCESLGQTALIPAISAIVQKNFLELAEYADSGQALDEHTLESVILALGSLINFAECSQSSRLAMNVTLNTGDSFVAWLVVAFTRRAGKASEASSLEQTHALVTFGYLSMLLCTLCLDGDIRNTVRASMKSRSLHPLIVTVEEFLHHFRTVEQVMVEDEAPNHFTDRFGGIVKELKEAEGLA